VFLIVHVHAQNALDDVDEFDARVLVRPQLLPRHRPKLGVVAVEAPLGRRVIERSERVGGLARARALGQCDALALARDRDERFFARPGEEELQADTEDERNPEQRRQRREETAALDFREQRRRQPGVLAQVDEADLLLQPERPDLGADAVVIQSVLQRSRQHLPPV
jgi:hypothetical protein